MIRRARHLMVILLAFASALLAGLQCRVFYLQALCATPPEAFAAYRTRFVEESGLRGALLDRRGGVLAQTCMGVNVYAWSRDVIDPPRVAEELRRLAGVDPGECLTKLRTQAWPLLAGDIRDPDLIQQLQALQKEWAFRALYLETVYHRIYPQGPLFTPLLGFVDAEGVGQSGLEKLYDDALKPGSGGRTVRRDGRGREMLEPGLEQRRIDPGQCVRLTLEPVLQENAEAALDELMLEYQPRWCQALILDPRNGELLAVAQRPAPAAGRPERGSDLPLFRILAAEESYAPGSTLKVHMMACTMERGVVQPGDAIDCEHGAAYFGGRRLTDIHGGYGVLSPTQILVHSSNIGIAKLALRLVSPDAGRGSAEFVPILDFYRSLGFGRRIVGLSGEAEGILTPPQKFDRTYSLISLSFGHEIAVSAIQAAAATAALINGGVWHAPVFRDAGDGQGTSHRVVSEGTSRQLREMLRHVVEQGQTERLRASGYSMGGKTGTPEKDEDRSLITPSFFCFGPVAEPRALVLVVADEPRKGRYASEIVAPTAADLLARTLDFLEVPPDRSEELWGELAMQGAPR